MGVEKDMRRRHSRVFRSALACRKADLAQYLDAFQIPAAWKYFRQEVSIDGGKWKRNDQTPVWREVLVAVLLQLC